MAYVSEAREDMNIVVVGHVDHGKSTIIGRLLVETNTLPLGKLETVREKCRRNAKPFEYAFLLDALKDEQSQGITIETARCFFKTAKRNYLIMDAPGHIEFLKNMVTGSSRAEAALIVIDANEGIKENSKRHGYMLSMLGIKQVAVLINKMDLVGYDKTVYDNIVIEYKEFLNSIGIDIHSIIFIPVSGFMGQNLTSRSSYMDWYQGSIVLDALDSFRKEADYTDKPFRMPVQAVYKFTNLGDTRRIVAGTVESGSVSVGDEIIFYPSGKRSHISTIEGFNTHKQHSVGAGFATGFTLTDQIYVKRGEIAVKASELLPKTATKILANIFWLGKKPMEVGREYYLKAGTAKVKLRLEKVVKIIDASSLELKDKAIIERNDVAECILRLNKPIAFDLQEDILKTSRFVIVDDYEISGGGIITSALEENQSQILEQPYEKEYLSSINCDNVIWQKGNITYNDRCRLLGQEGLVIWFTGLSGSGKSTIAIELENRLTYAGKAVYRLDGDNIRHGLNRDLNFSEEDRNENIRRIAEVALLFKDAGLITLVSAITPYEKMRKYVRTRITDANYIEVFVNTPIEECIRRDPKGFYKKVREGSISSYTGLSDPYEIPENPDIILDTMQLSVEECVEQCLLYIGRKYNEKFI